MINLKKMCILTAKNLCNLDTYQIIEILLLLRNAYIVPRNQNKFMFYINKYIDSDQLNQLYDLDQIKKNIKNIDAIACKLGLTLIRATNNKLEVTREERQKKEEIKKKQKVKAMVAKQRKDKEG